MTAGQAPIGAAPSPDAPFDLRDERLGPLPLINHFLERLYLPALLERFVPTDNPRCRLRYAKGIGVLLRSILVEREPIYRQGETVATFAPEAFGLAPEEASALSDDQIGRALARLYDADRGSLLTELVVRATREFGISLDEMHSDTTTVRFAGQYRAARGRSIRGRKAPFITYGFSKDHRPDLKQLLLVLTTSRDGAVPLQFRCEAGSFSDSRTHVETWEALRQLSGRPDFLYVADGKLCNAGPMDHIDRQGGKFITVIPRSRFEDKHFREWIQDHEPKWETVRTRRHPRRKSGPRDVWKVHRASLPSKEGWPVVWVFSTLLKIKQEKSRQERLARAVQDLERLAEHLSGSRPRKLSREEVWERVERLLTRQKVKKYVKPRIDRIYEHSYRQERPGRPGPETKFLRTTKAKWQLTWRIDDDAIEYDRKSDGMFPLITNDRSLMSEEVLTAYKRQPAIEKRFSQVKSVFEIAPVFLKSEDRVEALFFVYFMVLLVQALIERELRQAMEREKITELPLYPEERWNRRPTAEQIFRVFSLPSRHILERDGVAIHCFEPKLTDIQKQVLDLLGVPRAAYGEAR